MQVFEAIKRRSSCRNFTSEKVSQNLIEKLLEISINAPSGKNRQPWQFIVIEGLKKRDFEEIMENKLQEMKVQQLNSGSLKLTIKAIRQAPVIILVYNTELHNYKCGREYKRHRWMVDIQSIGGMIQTLLLAACEVGLSTLWICDVLYADKEISSFFNNDTELVAGVAIGYAVQKPDFKCRKSWRELTEWYHD